MIKKGLNGFQLKMIALILMVFDHIHYTLSSVFNIPLWFTMLGRISAPLFIFAMTIGMRYTRNPQKYLLRLWIGSVFMGFGNQWINQYFPLPGGGIILNNIFATLFIIFLILYGIQQIEKCRRAHRSYIRYIFLMLIPVFSSILLLFTIANEDLIYITRAVMIFVPSILFCEGGPLIVALGVGFYLCNQNKKKISIFYLAFSAFLLFSAYNPEFGLESVLLHDFQWMMVFALPFILLYNNEKGPGMKYFFYGFYPAHIYILTIFANMVGKQR